MRFLKSIAPPLAAMVLSACAAGDRDPLRTTEVCFQGYVDERALEAELRVATDCCSNFRDMTFGDLALFPNPDAAKPWDGRAAIPVPDLSRRVFSIGRKAKTFSFPQGKSRFSAFDLGTLVDKPKHLTLVPVKLGLTSNSSDCKDKFGKGRSDQEMRYLLPVITFLDAGRAPIVAGLSGAHSQNGIYAALRFSVPEAARYMIIHSDPSAFGTRLNIRGDSRMDVMAVPGTLVALPVRVDGSINGLVTSTGGGLMVFD